MKTNKLLLACLIVALPTGTTGQSPAVHPPSFTVPSVAQETIPDWQARVELARVLSYAQRYDEALAEYQRALSGQTANSALKAEFGQALGWAGRTEESIDVLASLPRADLPPSAAVLLADLLLGRKDFATAAELYQQAITARPEDTTTRFKLARVLSWLKRYDESLAEYRTLIDSAPGDVQLRRHHAQTLGWAGRVEQSIAEWRQTLPTAVLP